MNTRTVRRLAARCAAVASAVVSVLAIMSVSPALAQQADSAATCPRGAADDQSIMVSAVVREDPRVLAATIDSVLAELGYSISASQSSLGQWVTAPSHLWPSGTEQETWHGAEHPGVQVVVDLEREGEATNLRVIGTALCLVGTLEESRRPNSVETTLGTLAAVQVATEITRRLGAEETAREQ